jgi:hypothetical protein
VRVMRVCVRVFIGVSACACCERLCCTVLFFKKKERKDRNRAISNLVCIDLVQKKLNK